MIKGRDRNVYQRPDGTWVNKRQDAVRPSSVHEIQRDAEEAARGMLRTKAVVNSRLLAGTGSSGARTPFHQASIQSHLRILRLRRDTGASGNCAGVDLNAGSAALLPG